MGDTETPAMSVNEDLNLAENSHYESYFLLHTGEHSQSPAADIVTLKVGLLLLLEHNLGRRSPRHTTVVDVRVHSLLIHCD